MEKMKKYLFVFLAAIAAVLPVCAEVVEIDGVWYDLDPKKHAATVTYSAELQSEGRTSYNRPVAIDIPASVKHKGKSYKVKAVGDHAFLGAKVITVTLPAGVTSIGNEAFAECKSLTAVLLMSKEPPILGENVFRDTAKHGNYQYINVPCGALSAYKSQWAPYKAAIRERCQ